MTSACHCLTTNTSKIAMRVRAGHWRSAVRRHRWGLSLAMEDGSGLAKSAPSAEPSDRRLGRRHSPHSRRRTCAETARRHVAARARRDMMWRLPLALLVPLGTDWGCAFSRSPHRRHIYDILHTTSHATQRTVPHYHAFQDSACRRGSLVSQERCAKWPSERAAQAGSAIQPRCGVKIWASRR